MKPINRDNCKVLLFSFEKQSFAQRLQGDEALTMADSGNKRELEAKVLQKVAEVISAIKNAKHVDQVISALHSLAVLLFPVDASIIAGQSRLSSLHFFFFFFSFSEFSNELIMIVRKRVKKNLVIIHICEL